MPPSIRRPSHQETNYFSLARKYLTIPATALTTAAVVLYAKRDTFSPTQALLEEFVSKPPDVLGGIGQTLNHIFVHGSPWALVAVTAKALHHFATNPLVIVQHVLPDGPSLANLLGMAQQLQGMGALPGMQAGGEAGGGFDLNPLLGLLRGLAEDPQRR